MNIQSDELASLFSKNPTQTVTLGMGCFWSPDALFGQLPGVIRTQVGYAGGGAANPTYREMGDHTETVQIDFDPTVLTFEDILDVFWSNHNPVNINDYKGRQYMSLVLYHNEEQKEIISYVLQKVKELGKAERETAILPFSKFYPAEERHQKYYLKRYPDALEKLHTLYPSQADLMNSKLAARLNGLAKGYTNLERIISEIQQWAIDLNTQRILIDTIREIRW
ncbi:peptide-methionine (S)-S-oxide reductase MsrA [Paenibacillus pini]|uniref:Peptide methionine sulfoxide reductase MsrA n=1 Tax=Paenibacillus pini JCM 16418 TaxID=1236976 RepID=W7YNS0_9BACL|nr:peptide-methionine (S)-S-oxide reductase MsrA [Paenibacillus pini]GAF09263.1 peptide methionine sulfoxide reductase MsrA [Paenibacillus pini JCM 16418]